jgi:hypothetical protein
MATQKITALHCSAPPVLIDLQAWRLRWSYSAVAEAGCQFLFFA